MTKSINSATTTPASMAPSAKTPSVARRRSVTPLGDEIEVLEDDNNDDDGEGLEDIEVIEFHVRGISDGEEDTLANARVPSLEQGDFLGFRIAGYFRHVL